MSPVTLRAFVRIQSAPDAGALEDYCPVCGRPDEYCVVCGTEHDRTLDQAVKRYDERGRLDRADGGGLRHKHADRSASGYPVVPLTPPCGRYSLHRTSTSARAPSLY